MTQNICVNGQAEGLKVLSASVSLKKEVARVFPQLPDNWRDQMKEYDPHYKTDKGNSRLTNIRSGRVAPSLGELKELKRIAGVQ